MNKPFLEVVGASHTSMNDALTRALADIKQPDSDYEVLETTSREVDGKKRYQIKLKVSLEACPS